jgi:hypothetical protein
MSLRSLLTQFPLYVLVATGCIAATKTSVSPSATKLPTCQGPFTCDGEMNMCRASAGGLTGGSFTFSDEGYGVRSDGRGPYFAGKDGAGVFAGIAAVLFWRRPPADTVNSRHIVVDLNSPVAGDVSRKLGVIRDSYAEIAAQWYSEPASIDSLNLPVRLQHSVTQVPVGFSVTARQVNIGIHIDGRYHILQMGPQPTGHCFAEGTAIYGDGTTEAKISRPAENVYVVEAPPGSVARLFDTYHTNKHAVNKGLYHIAFRYVIQK